MVSFAEKEAVWALPPESVTLNVSLALAAVVDVPVIAPEVPFRDKPVGNAPLVSDHV